MAKASSGSCKLPTICLAASGGGHVRQLLDLRSLWSQFPHFFVTEDTALGRSIAADTETDFVPHFALGQAKLGNPIKMLASAARSIVRSAFIVKNRRPDVVISTGAGSQIFVIIFARLLGAKIVLIDSFARFRKPSAFARLAGPFAHRRYSQSAEAAKHWPGCHLVDPLKPLDLQPLAKQNLTFATVGATLPFDRLVDIVLEARRRGWIEGELVIQTGDDGREFPELENTRYVRSLPFAEIGRLLARAKLVICHGGTGSIVTALQNDCRVIVIPRLHGLSEHYDDHQLEIAEAFQDRGLVEIARDADGIRIAQHALASRQNRPVTTDYSELVRDLRQYMAAEGLC